MDMLFYWERKGIVMNLKELLEQRKDLMDQASKATTNEELDKIEVALRKLDLQIKGFEESGSQSGFNPIATFSNNVPNTRNMDDDIYSSVEYRNAFKDYIVKGTPIPEKFKPKSEERSEITLASDIAAVIPTTILNKVIEDMTVEGKILPRITQSAYQGGVDIPISELNITASWLNDGTVSEEQKAKMSAKISFSYHMLEARVSVSLLSQTVSLAVFESTIVKQIKKAMTRAIEAAIISGTGSGQPLGITKYTDLPAEQIVEMNDETVGTVAAWADVEAKIPEAYEDRAIYLMSKATWEKYLNGMTDKNGQKIGLGKINEKGQKILNGREVLTVDNLPSYMTASDGDIFAVVCDLEQYYLNSNLAMYYKKYQDEEKNKWVHKAIMIADGKMALGKDSSGKYVGAKGLIYVKKKLA